MKHLVVFSLLLSIFGTASILAAGERVKQRFQVTELPRGKLVTLPSDAATLVPITMAVSVQPTSTNQLIKLTRLYKGGGAPPAITLAIYDPHAPRVQYLKIKDESSVLYALKSTRAIRIVSQLATRSLLSGVPVLKIESDKPLGVAR